MLKRDPRNKQEIWGLILFGLFSLTLPVSGLTQMLPLCSAPTRSDKTCAETTVDQPVEFGVAVGSILGEHTG